MNVKCSVGISRGFSLEQKRRLLAEVQRRLPDRQVYAGHDYYDSFSFDDEKVVMTKCKDDSVELLLICDGGEMYPMV
jgi:Tol biopolymer transport system component